MKEKSDLGSIIDYIEKNIQRLSSSPRERIDEFLTCYFIKEKDGVYKNKTIKISSGNGEVIDIPMINLLPVNIMEMKKATITVNGERLKSRINDPDKVKKNGDELVMSEEGNIGLIIDFQAESPTEYLMRIMEKNFLI